MLFSLNTSTYADALNDITSKVAKSKDKIFSTIWSKLLFIIVTIQNIFVTNVKSFGRADILLLPNGFVCTTVTLY